MAWNPNYKANEFEKYVKHFRVDNDLTQVQMAKELNVHVNQLQVLEKLNFVDDVLFNKVLDFMGVNEETEEKLSDLVHGVKRRCRKLNLSTYPSEIAVLLSDIADKHTELSTVKIKKIIKLIEG